MPIDDTPGVAFARPAWKAQSGKHEIHIQLNDLDKALAKCQETMNTIPGLREHFANFLGIQPKELTPQLVHVFSIMHELGHVREYFDNEHNPDALRGRNQAQKMSLPIGGVAVSKLLARDSAHQQAVKANWGHVSSTLSVHTFDDLVRKQHDAYRGMSAENFADRTAADVFWSNPHLIDQLTSPNLAYYRKQRASL